MKLSLALILTCIINIAQISAQAPQICNGYAELCSKSYSEIAYATTHNAYAYVKSIAANQIFDISTQLKDGIRGFMLDGNTKTTATGPIELCHGQCNFLDSGLAVDALKTFTQFLQNNPNEVITIFWENIGKHPASQYQQIYSDSGLLQYAHTQAQADNNNWPTLSEMIQSGKKVVNFIDSGADPSVPWLMNEYDFVFETPFQNSDINAWTCTIDRPKGQQRPMYVLNHFLSGTSGFAQVNLPQPNSANVSNGVNLQNHAKTCQQSLKSIPNFIAVDFYEEGTNNVNVFSVVSGLNNVQYTPKQIGNGTTVANLTNEAVSTNTSANTSASNIILPRLFESFFSILSILVF